MDWITLSNVLCYILLPSVVLSQFYECPEPWVEFESSCYHFDLAGDTIEGATLDCEKDGASLLSINFYEEHTFITGWLINNAVQFREWYTSGRRDTTGENQFLWEGDGTTIESFQFWLSDVSNQEGTRIVYATEGGTWGWKMVTEQDTVSGEEISRPYICEISKTQIWKILEEERNFDYGAPETDLSAIEMGPVFTEEPQDTIYEANPFKTYIILQCIADGNPAPAYTWYKRKDFERNVIDPQLDDRLTITNGRLTINNPDNTIDNADFYDCVAENKFGAIKSRKARIIFGYLNDFPKSQREPLYARAFEGAAIECSPPSHGYDLLLYTWYKDVFTNFIRPELKPYTFISNNGKLYFSSVTTDDSGNYTCSVSSPLEYGQGKSSLPTELKVREAVGNNFPPQIVSEFPAIFPPSPLKGDDVRIECFAYGTSTINDPLVYSWTKVNGPLPLNSQLLDQKRVLYIPNVQVIHSGEYKCSVSSRQGTNEATIELSVEAAPYFIIPLKNQHVDRDSELIWQALADGIPTVNYKWYRNAEELIIDDLDAIDRDRYKIQQNRLTIQNVHPDRDAGMYQLSATNAKGTIYSSAQLRVLSFAPTFLKYPLQQRQYATLRGNITIICQPEAAPPAEKTWQFNGRDLELSTDQNSRVYTLPNGNLVIKDVGDSDAGHYTCIARNSLGEAKSSGNLTVLPTTTIGQEPRSTTVQVNKTAIFQCQASFNPALDITYDWYHNDRKIEFIKIKVIGDTPIIMREDYFERGSGINRGALYIYHTQYFHAGFYTCVVLTTSETISRTVKLDVVGPPFPPVGLEGTDVTTNSIILSWKMGVPAANGNPVFSYTVEGFDKKEGFWRKFKTNIRGQDVEDKRTEVTGLSPFSQYKFRVRAENIYGIGQPSEVSEFFTTDEAPPEVYPLNVGRCVNKVGTLCITWTPIPLAQQNGGDFKYLVKFKQSFIQDEDYTEILVNGADSNQYVALVGQDNFYKLYDITVQGQNVKGRGPSAPEVTIRSAMGIPTGQSTNLRIWQHNATALLAEWDPVQDTVALMKGKLQGYRINYWRECCETEEMAIFNQVQGQRDSGMIIGLYPDTYYWITVQVYNEAGYGPKTDAIKQETLRAAPKEAPQEVHVYVEGYNSIRVEWRGVSTSIEEEPLTGYRVRFWRQSENRYLAEDREAYKKTHLVVDDLDVDTYYELRVFGYSRGGDGLMSSPIIQFILGPDCFVREDSPEKDYVYKCRGETGNSANIPSQHIIFSVLMLSLHTILVHL